MDSPKQPAVLGIEDHEYLREMICAALKSIGVPAISADSGAQGLELAIRERPPAIMVDVCLPEMNGADVAREIEQRLPQTPVVGMSGELFPEGRTAFDAFLAKPFGVGELERLLHGLKLDFDVGACSG